MAGKSKKVKSRKRAKVKSKSRAKAEIRLESKQVKKKSIRKAIRKEIKPKVIVRKIRELEQIRELKELGIVKEKPKEKAKPIKKQKAEAGKLKIIKEIKPKLEVKKPKAEEFLESFSETTKRKTPVLESGQEQLEPTAELEDVLARVVTPREEGKEEKRKEGEGPSYFASQPSYFTEGGESSSGTAFGARGEESVDDIVDRLRRSKTMVERPPIFSGKKDFGGMDKSRTLVPVELPEMKGGMSQDYVMKYAKPHEKGKSIEWIKKEGVDARKYRKAK